MTLPNGAARAGDLSTVRFYSPALARNWAYNVYLPEHYADGGLRYPVLFLLHGFGGNRDEWVEHGDIAGMADRLIAAGDIPPCIIVMPSAGRSWYLDGTEDMETAIIRDLIPEIDSRFRTISRRDGRLIAGESMGGYGALRFILKYPELFSAGALLSPAIYVPEPPPKSGARLSPVFARDGRFDPAIWIANDYPALLKPFLARGIEVPLYLGVGNLDELNIGYHMAKLYVIWRGHGWSTRYRVAVGRHDFIVWRKLMPGALTFIFHSVHRPERGTDSKDGAPPQTPLRASP